MRDRALVKVVLGDGAEWIWNPALLHFLGAYLYHARERFTHQQSVQQKRWMMYHQNRLDKGRIEKFVNSLPSIEVREAELRETIRIEGDDFERNADRVCLPQVPATTPLRGFGRH